jgi:hypothetical protein
MVRSEIHLRASRWRVWCTIIVVLAAALAVQIVLQRESVAALWQAIAIGVCLLGAFGYIWRTRSTTTPTDTIIFAGTSELWLGNSNARHTLSDDAMPRLIAMREYLGLVWIQTTAGQWLIWPDQLIDEHARRMRIWLARVSLNTTTG